MYDATKYTFLFAYKYFALEQFSSALYHYRKGQLKKKDRCLTNPKAHFKFSAL